jgi:hypothetical protein
LDLRIEILWLIPPKVSTKLDINKRNVFLKLVSLPPSLSKRKYFLPSSKSGESSSKTRKKKSSGTCHFCGRIRHVKSKFYLKLESLNETMQQRNISLPKPSSSGKGNALST